MTDVEARRTSPGTGCSPGAPPSSPPRPAPGSAARPPAASWRRARASSSATPRAAAQGAEAELAGSSAPTGSPRCPATSPTRRRCGALFDTAVQEHGRLDIVVNNAGLGGTADLVDMTDEQWTRVLDVTLNGTFRCTRAALRLMRDTAAAASSSTTPPSSAGAPRPGQAHYAAAKAGVMALTRCAAMEAAEYGVRVNAVSPSLAMHPHLVKVTIGGAAGGADRPRGVRPVRRALGGGERDRVPGRPATPRT